MATHCPIRGSSSSIPKYVLENCFAKYIVVKCFISSNRKNIIVGGRIKVGGECVNHSSVNCNVPSVQGSNNNKPLAVILKLIQGAKDSIENTLGPLEGLRGGLVHGALRPLFLLKYGALNCNLFNQLFYCSVSFERENYVVSFRISELNGLKHLLI